MPGPVLFRNNRPETKPAPENSTPCDLTSARSSISQSKPIETLVATQDPLQLPPLDAEFYDISEGPSPVTHSSADSWFTGKTELHVLHSAQTSPRARVHFILNQYIFHDFDRDGNDLNQHKFQIGKCWFLVWWACRLRIFRRGSQGTSARAGTCAVRRKRRWVVVAVVFLAFMLL